MAASRDFEGRILAILDPHSPRRARGPLAIVPASVMLVFGLGLAVAQPATTAPPDPSRMPVSAGRAPTASGDTTGLVRLLTTDPEPSVRRSAAWSLQQNPGGAAALVQALRYDADPGVREMAAWALGQQQDSAVLPELYSALKSEAVPAVRATTIWAIGQTRGPVTPTLLSLAADSNAAVVEMAIWAIGQNAPPQIPTIVVSRLPHPARLPMKPRYQRSRVRWWRSAILWFGPCSCGRCSKAAIGPPD
jgi:hypothetical protein